MKTLYTASCKWRGPSDSEKVIYYAGITQNKYTNLKLVDSFDDSYPDNTAFKLVGTSSNDKERIYEPSSDDTVVVFGIDSSITYGIDNDKNLLIFDENFPITDITTDSNQDGVPNIHVTLVKNYASLHKANSVTFEVVRNGIRVARVTLAATLDATLPPTPLCEYIRALVIIFPDLFLYYL